MKSHAPTVASYLSGMRPERREIVELLRDTISAHLQPGFDEAMRWGMLCFEVPMTISGPTYNGQPLVYIAIADQKDAVSLYLMPVYQDPAIADRFRAEWIAATGRLDAGKSCVRIRRADGLPLATVAWVAALHTPEQFVERYNQARSSR